MAIGGFAQGDAEQYAYFVSEAATWESFLQLAKVNKRSEAEMKETLETINSAIVVEETPKIQIDK
jgi:hypothetical protein